MEISIKALKSGLVMLRERGVWGPGAGPAEAWAGGPC